MKIKRKITHFFVCGDCKWIFREIIGNFGCERCNGVRIKPAFREFGGCVYRLAKTQKPWIEASLEHYQKILQERIREMNKIKSGKIC